MTGLKQPIVYCPHDIDDAQLLSEVAGDHADEIFVASYVTNIGHAHAAATLLDQAGSVDSRFWICPPTRMNANTLMQKGD